MVVESAIPELAKRPVGVENALPEAAKRRLLVEGFAPVQQNDPKLLQVHLRCSANKTIVDGYRREHSSVLKNVECTRCQMY